MKKTIVLGIAAAALASAGSALALTSELSGQFKVAGIVDNHTIGRGEDPDRLVDQRLRLRYTAGVNEYLKVVYWGEIDMQWGDASYVTARNEGAGIGGDSVNLETKNAFAEIKFAGTPLTATVGLQNIRDDINQVLYWTDAGGVKINAKSGIVDTNLGWFKFLEGNRADGDKGTGAGSFGSARAEDDLDMFVGQVSVTPMKNLKVGVELDYMRNQGSVKQPGNFVVDLPPNLALPTGTTIAVEREDLYYLSVNGSYKVAMVDLSGWFLYNWGTLKTTIRSPSGGETGGFVTSDEDIKLAGYAASAKASVNIPGGVNAYMRGMFWSDAGDSDDKIKAIFNPLNWGPEVTPFLIDTGMPSIFVCDGNLVGTYSGYAGNAMFDAAYSGYGLIGGYLGARFVPATLPMFYVGGQAGYYRARSDENGYQGVRAGKVLGSEVAGKVGYKFANGAFDLSLNGAYAWLGDFYDSTVTRATGVQAGKLIAHGENPDNAYVYYVAANIPF